MTFDLKRPTKALINSTAILSLTLYIVPPFAVQAQDLPVATVGEAQVLCLPDDQTPCPEGLACVIANAEQCQATAEAALAAAAAAAAEQPAAEAPAAEQPAAEAPAVEEQPAVEAPAEEQPAAEAPAVEEQPAVEAPAEQPAAEAPATEQPATEQPVTEDQSAEPAVVDPAQTEQSAEPAPEVVPETEPAAEPTAEPAAEPTPEAAQDPSAEPAPAAEPAPVAEPEPQVLTEDQVAAQAAQDQAAIEAAQKAQEEAAAAALADPNLQPVEAPVVEEQAAAALDTVLDAPAAPTATATEAPAAPAPVTEAATAAAVDTTTPPADQPVPQGATVTTETVTAADTRSAAQEFAAAPVTVAPGQKSGLSNLEKAGLLALGALAIGTMLNSNKQVVSNTGDRVVVRQDDGSYQIYKDDNALLREPGSKVTTQTFQDGSTRTIVAREDGSQISTIRDASGRVLQRVAYDRKGRATVLIDDLKPEEPIVISQLPKPRPQRIDVTDPDAAMRAALLAAQVDDYGAKFSLRQIRTIPEVRHLAPTIDVREITFKSGSAALDTTEAKSLNALGRFIGDMIAQNPGEVFLIEGHTDAVGSAYSNLTLSDRRAETVAKALTEYFGVPPENMVVQGYGESELLIPTLGDERANRRVAVRIITPLLRQ